MSKPADKWEGKDDGEPEPAPEPEPPPDKPPDKWDKPDNGKPPDPEPPEPEPPEPPEPEGDVLWVDPGDGPLEIRGRADLTVQGRGGVVRLEGRGEDVLWLHDCRRVTVRDLELTDGYRALRITDSQDITLENVSGHHCEQQGLFTCNLEGLTVIGGAWHHISAGGEHACYLSENASDCRFAGVRFESGPQGCFQCNAEGAADPITGIYLENCTVAAEKAVNAMGAQVTFRGGHIQGRINVDDVGPWEATVTLDGCPHDGPVNEFGGSRVVVV